MARDGLRTFALIWAGQVVSQTGTAMTRFALLVWVYEQTGRATDVALLGFFTFVPLFLMGPIAGVWVDRLDRRLVMLAADAGAGLMTAGILGLYTTGRLEVWHLYVAEALAGLFEAFQVPAYTAATTLLLPERHYGRAAGLRSVASLGADGLAPFAAGLVLVGFGIAGVLVIDLATFAVAAAALLMVRVPRPGRPDGAAAAPGGRFWAEMRDGARYVRARPGLVWLMLVHAGINFFGSLTYLAILPPMILARSGGSRMTLASVQSVLGGAGVVGGLLMAVWGGPRRRIHGVLAATAISFLLGDLLFALGRSVTAWLLAAFVAAVFIPIMLACDQAIWQAKVAPGVQGRVFGLIGAVRRAPMPLAYLAGGVLADGVFEPALAPGGRLVPLLGPLVGVGPGAGMAAMFLATAVLGTGMSLAGYLVPTLRRVDDERGP